MYVHGGWLDLQLDKLDYVLNNCFYVSRTLVPFVEYWRWWSQRTLRYTDEWMSQLTMMLVVNSFRGVIQTDWVPMYVCETVTCLGLLFGLPGRVVCNISVGVLLFFFFIQSSFPLIWGLCFSNRIVTTFIRYIFNFKL